MKNKDKLYTLKDSISKYDENEDLKKLDELLSDISTYGWNSNQWSKNLMYYKERFIKRYIKNFNSMDEQERKVAYEKFKSENKYLYFIESFGREDSGYLRGEGLTLVECAENILRQAKSITSCEHQWKYTHNNGNKTCEKCGEFTGCTPEEAIKNYEYGNVDFDAERRLYFHNNRAICDCGSKQVYYLEKSMLNNNQFQCVQCDKYMPLKYDVKEGKHYSLSLHPNDDGYENGSLIDINDTYDRHKLVTLGLVNPAFFNQLLTRYAQNMLDHYLYFKKEIYESFQDWVEPYIKECVVKTDTQILVDEKKYTLEGLTNINVETENNEIKSLSYDFLLKTPEVENDEPEKVFGKIFDAILNSKDE